jgi:hypothetical protein
MPIHRRRLAALASAISGIVASALACSSPPRSGLTLGMDGGPGARPDVAVDGPSDAGESASSDGGGPLLTELAVSAVASVDGGAPITLVPPFSPHIHDYYVRCSAGANRLALTLSASSGATARLLQPVMSPSQPTQSLSLTLDENQALVAAATRGTVSTAYWVRCLPHDFPELQMNVHAEEGAPPPGYYLVGDFAPTNQGAYAIVLDGNGVPVWYHLGDSSGMCDVDDVVSGTVSFISNLEEGFEILRLDPWTTTHAVGAVPALDGHELRVLSNGHYVVFTSGVRSGVDLTGLHFGLLDGGVASFGPNSNIQDCTVVELDPDGGVVWQWSAFDHFDPVKTSTFPWYSVTGPTGPDGGVVVDPFHCNSIDVDPANGNLLVSARNMDAIFYIDKATGAVLWKMGGPSSCKDDAVFVSVADPFYRQHDARLQPGWAPGCNGGTGQISVFDDHSYEPGTARAVVYDVMVGDVDGGTHVEGGCPDGGAMISKAGAATVTWQLHGSVTSVDLGSFRITADGSRIIGWGDGVPDLVFTEVNVRGNDLLDFEFTDGNVSYRVIKVPETALDLPAMRATAGLP